MVKMPEKLVLPSLGAGRKRTKLSSIAFGSIPAIISHATAAHLAHTYFQTGSSAAKRLRHGRDRSEPEFSNGSCRPGRRHWSNVHRQKRSAGLRGCERPFSR